ncbi:hypothetical protein EJ06DRAFT_540555 [Trichodelitschia bisporula]|uniref:Impact N-terminal domain-containing protein n=1 Tax=Trichodelitschia bisporula TaxID=703511 RepID=A0A6G1IA82_9PEZI|nr:hypothetical protein EJ06DRAFT_540555 [Trichodelitschia bisporula]
MSAKRPLPDASDSPIFRSEHIDDRKSTFIALFSPTLRAPALQALPELRSASHRIAAWRLPSSQKTLTPQSSTLYSLGHDDDGEQWAGSKLEKLLVDLKVEGTVVVGRWYGGINLGPVRFTHIENCARDAIKQAAGYHTPPLTKCPRTGDGSPQQGVLEQAAKAALVSELLERNRSISVLRDLVNQKRAAQSLPYFEALPLARLRALERAKDATTAFLLKEIDKLEKLDAKNVIQDPSAEHLKSDEQPSLPDP